MTSERNTALWCEMITSAQALDHQKAWEALADSALEPNPFYRPAFLLPLLLHDGPYPDLRLLVVWDSGARTRMLALQPVMAPRARGGRSMTIPFDHPAIPVAVPLLTSNAQEAAEALVLMLEQWRHRTERTLNRIPREGAFATLLRRVIEAQGWTVECDALSAMTYGLHLQARFGEQIEAAITVLKSGPELREGFERLAGAAGESFVRDVRAMAFQRSMSRGMSKSGHLAILIAEDPQESIPTGALVLTEGEQAWIWSVKGPKAEDPMTQARLAEVVARETHARPVVVTPQRLSGIGCAPYTLDSWSILQGHRRPAGQALMKTARKLAASFF